MKRESERTKRRTERDERPQYQPPEALRLRGVECGRGADCNDGTGATNTCSVGSGAWEECITGNVFD